MKRISGFLVFLTVVSLVFCNLSVAGENDGFYTALRLGYFPYTADIEGTAGGRDFDTEADLSDIMDETETLLGGEIEIGKGRFFLNFTGFFQEIETTKGSSTNGAKIVSSETGLNPMLGYRVYQQGLSAFDVMAGIYYVKIDLEADINSTTLGDITVDRDVNFTDPMIGLRGYHGFNKKFGLGATVKVGGFGVGSESHYDVSANLVYHINDMFAVSGGYRVWSWEYEDSGATVSKLEQTLSGPFLGLQIMFR